MVLRSGLKKGKAAVWQLEEGKGSSSSSRAVLLPVTTKGGESACVEACCALNMCWVQGDVRRCMVAVGSSLTLTWSTMVVKVDDEQSRSAGMSGYHSVWDVRIALRLIYKSI